MLELFRIIIFIKTVCCCTQNYWVFWTFPIVRCFWGIETWRFGNWIFFCHQVKGWENIYSGGPLRKSSSQTGQHLSDLQSYLITRDQANSAGDNKKVYNKSFDKARTCVELEIGKEVEICATIITNKTKSMSTNAMKQGENFEDMYSTLWMCWSVRDVDGRPGRLSSVKLVLPSLKRSIHS
jgi:hypothetical protein